MTENGGCDQFQDELDKIFEGEASETDTLRVKRHAESCPDCAMILKIQDNLGTAPLNELEAAVPDDLVDGMWPRVEREITRDDRRRAAESPRRPLWHWVTAAQAAAIVLLAVAGTIQFSELRQVRVRELALAEQVAVQRDQLAALEWRTEQVFSRPPEFAGGEWRQRFGRSDRFTVGEMARFLEKLPPDTQVLNARETRGMMAMLPRLVTGAGTEELAGIHAGDGLQAGEALRVIAALNLDPSQRFPASLIEKFSRRFD